MTGFPHRLIRFGLSTLVLAVTATVVPAGETHTAVAQAPSEEVVAEVNGEHVTLRDVERGLGRLHRRVSVEERQVFDLDRLVFRLVNDLLLSQEARAMGLDESDAIRDELAELREERALALMDRELIRDNAMPDDETVAKEYRQRYRTVTLRVVTAYEKPEAEALWAELQAGADMEALAREKSVDPIAIRGGLMKPAPVSDLQREIAERAVRLEPGELDGPIRTQLGWSIIRLEAREEADPEGLEAKRHLLTDVLAMQASKVLRAQRAVQLRERIPVVYDTEQVEAIQPRREPDGRLLPRVADRSKQLVKIGDDRILTAGDYEDALISRWTGVRNEEAARASAPIVFRELVDRELLKIEARRLGFYKRPEVEEVVRAREKKLLVDRYLSDVIAAGVEVSPEEMTAYYEENLSGFNRPPRFRLGQITVETEAEARRIVEQLRGGADLAWLAEKHSIDRLKSEKGDRGWFDPVPGVDPFNDAVLASEAGDVLEPTGAEGNITIFKVIAKETRGPYPYEQVSGNVRRAVFERKLAEEIDRYLTILRERSEIELFEDRLASLRIRGSESEAEAESAGGMSHGH